MILLQIDVILDYKLQNIINVCMMEKHINTTWETICILNILFWNNAQFSLITNIVVSSAKVFVMQWRGTFWNEHITIVIYYNTAILDVIHNATYYHVFFYSNNSSISWEYFSKSYHKNHCSHQWQQNCLITATDEIY